jgi:hypothetical protein
MPLDPSLYPGYLGHSNVVSGVNVYTDAAGTTLTSTDGTEVKYWRKDAAGANGSFFQSGLGTSGGPALKNAVRPTGLDALRFDGVNDLMRNIDAALVALFKGTTQDFTFYIVAGAVTASANIAMSWNPALDAGSANWGYLQLRNNGASPNRQICFRDYDDGVGATDAVSIGTNWAVITVKYTASTGKCRIYTNTDAGAEVSSGSGASTIDQIVLGGLVRLSNPNGQLFTAMDVGVICWYNQAHSDANRLAIINGLYADSIGPPAAPTSPVATAIYKGVFLTWTGSDGATSYVVERSATGSGGWSTIATVTQSGRTYFADTALTSGVQWFYRISAVNTGGTSSPTSNVNATTGSTLSTASDICPMGSLGDYWKPDALASGAVSSWAGSINSKALVQGTGTNQPSRSTAGVGTAPYYVSFDGINDWLSYDAGGPIFEGDFTVLYVLKLGSGAGRTVNENHFIAAKAGTDNQTLDAYTSRFGGAIIHSDCRLNDGATEYSIGGWAIDTSVHLMGMTGNTDGYGKLFYDVTLSKQQRIRPLGGALTFDKWTVGAHRRESTDSFCKGEFGDIALWAYELNADQIGYFQQLTQPRYVTPTTAVNDPIAITENLISGHWSAAVADHAGGAGTSPAIDNTSLGNNYQLTDIGGYTREFTNTTTTVTYQTNESGNGKPALAMGTGGILQETTGGSISGEVDAGSAWTWLLVARPDSLSGSAQSLGCFTDNGASGAYVTLRVKAGPLYELASRDNSSNDFSGSGGVPNTTAHCLIVTFDGNQTLKLYVDGVLKITLTITASTLWTFSKHVLGGLYRGSLSEGFTDLRIFDNRVASREVSASERGQLVSWSNVIYGTALPPAGALTGGLTGSILTGPGRLAR